MRRRLHQPDRRTALALLAAVACGALVAGNGVFDFDDVAPAWGISVRNTYGGVDRKDYILETTGNGVALVDYDNDGDLDVLLLNGTTLAKRPGGTPPRIPALYRNDGGGRFVDVAAEAGLAVEGWAQAACAGDVDNDGWTDLLVTYYGHDRLYRNNGRGRFEDITAKAGLRTTGTRYGSGCTMLDYDRDGRLDLFISNYVDLDLSRTPKPGQNSQCLWKEIPVMCGPRGLPLARNVLLHQESDGTFRDVSAAAGILKPGGRYALQAVSADFDHDGWPDIYVACDMTPSLLYQNSGKGTFEERGVEAGVAYNFDGRLQAGMGVAVADFDNDGRLDIAKTNFSGDLTSLFRNEDGRYFSDVSRERGLGARQFLGWGIAFADFDDDGWRDLLVANGHVYPEVSRAAVGDKYLQETLLYRNRTGQKFEEVTSTSGPALAVPRPARGLAVGDLDGDGRLEAVILNMNSVPTVLRNRAAGGHFLNLRLEGTLSNRSAIGARVEVEAAGIKQVDQVMSGGSFYSQNSLILHFGLGAARTVNRVTVHWPSGGVQEFKGLPADALHVLREN